MVQNFIRAAGSTSNILHIQILDSSSLNGEDGLTGLNFGTGGLVCYYMRAGAAAPVAVTLATIATLGTWETGGFRAVDGTNMPGIYELDLPNAVFATGAKSVKVMLQGAANMAQCVLDIQLPTVDPYVSGGNVNAHVVDMAAGSVTAAAIATDAIDADAMASSALNEIAAEVLKHDFSAVTGEAARSLLNACRRLRNKIDLSGSTLTVSKEDDSTPAWLAVVTTNAAAEPVTSIDPT